MNKLNAKDFELYWEDVGEKLIYAELDDYAWKLAEKIFRYKKERSVYIYHSGKLAAYYSRIDTDKESEVGYEFYRFAENQQRVISLKKDISTKVDDYLRKQQTARNFDRMSSDQIRLELLNSLDLFREALGVHYLTQPQFFLAFEKGNKNYTKSEDFSSLAIARLKYTRKAWTKMMHRARDLFKNLSRHKKIPIEMLENLKWEELKSGDFKNHQLEARERYFVLVSRRHNLEIFTGQKARSIVKLFEDFGEQEDISGVIGNRGYAKAKCFVVKNEKLDLKNLPSGMGKGMVLIVQNAWPEFAPYYKLASAIVTNEGGITSHGVVVSRELGIPCVIGTKIATKIFKTGDMVEVDAEKGLVRKIS